MKSLRLNAALRQSILSNFMIKWGASNKSPEEPVSFDEDESDLAYSVWRKLYGKIDFNAVPTEFICRDNSIRLQLPTDAVVEFYFMDSELNSVYEPAQKTHGVKYVFKNTDPDWLEYSNKIKTKKVLKVAVKEHEKLREAFYSQVSQVLNSVNTTGQFVEVWPEAEAFIPQDISNPSKINLPSVNLLELNKQL